MSKPNQSGKILVTGAGGFIGSHLTQQLLESGYSVKAFVSYRSDGSAGWLDSLPQNIKSNFEIFRGDVRDPNGVETALKGCNAVCHLAALIGIPYSYHSPDSYVDTNIKGTLNVLQAGRKLGLEKIVCTSTSEVYGTAQFVPITEEHPLAGQSPYSATKIGSDQIALSFYRSFETPVTIIRPFNTYGPRQSQRAVIPTIILQLLAGAQSIKLGSASPTRDFCFVRDTAAGFISALESSNVGNVFNLSTGHEISVHDTALLIGQLMGKTVNFEVDKDRLRPEKSEVERLCGDSSKAKMLLKWNPLYSGAKGLEKGLLETIQWMSANAENYRTNANQYAV